MKVKHISKRTLFFGLAGTIGAIFGNGISEPFLRPNVSTFFQGLIDVTVWTAIISFGIALTLIISQNYYLKKPVYSKSIFKAGFIGILTGAIAGAIAQIAFSYTAQISINVEIASRIVCWGIFGLGTGLGISIFVPNYPKKTAMTAGLLGGIIGGAFFRFSFGLIPEILSRFIGVGIVGFFIGLMISIFEEILREAWLTIDYGNNEKINISLGKKPLILGSSSSADIYLPKDKNYPAITAEVVFDKSKVIINNKINNQVTELRNGSKIGFGTILIIVNTR